MRQRRRDHIEGYAEIGGVVHVLFEDVRGTHACRQKAGFRIVQEQQVVVISVEDAPGAAARVFQRIADAHINIKYSYFATGNRLVIAADDREAVVKALSGVVEP